MLKTSSEKYCEVNCMCKNKKNTKKVLLPYFLGMYFLKFLGYLLTHIYNFFILLVDICEVKLVYCNIILARKMCD